MCIRDSLESAGNSLVGTSNSCHPCVWWKSKAAMLIRWSSKYGGQSSRAFQSTFALSFSCAMINPPFS
eukprot:8448224-Alexandrium_andersonii.AAC.1